ncbi:MAG: YgeY family selenium metabolism-linked hydrolase [Anaerolineales bacterium]|nr:YgeY family selenium metabolism-linked hydrolase [Anaerolineales bacterium]MCS7248156.1 YgeY family selenium metabolism-linked hydrolase [Anaerolineales bacterium]MDW8161968.1 YgeY family selenium metabolism-linked hydrolase [Anaerolineales bacterium]MDW8447169.1 YgeY family selenium metabolism-linked hydrolase [Anaerolineales bacterium]
MGSSYPYVDELRRAAEELYPQMVNFLVDLIRIRSYTGEEAEAVERTLTELRHIGCEKVWMDTAGNALGQIGEGRPLLLYDAHLDTNEISDESSYPFPPLEGQVVGETLYGLGASDCKGGVAAIVYGLAILGHLNLRPPCTVVAMGATLEEEAEGFALRSLVERDGLRPDAVLIAEASDLTLRIGHRGRCEIRITTKGRAAHASVPEQGENAILKMIPVIERVEAMGQNLPSDPLLGQGTQVITQIRSPNTPNSVPEWCEITIDRRLVAGETVEGLFRQYEEALAPLGAKVSLPVQPVRTHTGLRLDDLAFFPGWTIEESHPLVQAGRRTYELLWGRAAPVRIWRFSTDGTYSAGRAGIPTLGFGPQEEQYVHTPEDQVNLRKVKEAALFYALFPFVYAEIFDQKEV